MAAPPTTTAPAQTGCPACGAAGDAFVATPLAAGGEGGTCRQCGYAAGEAHRCPHCRAVARAAGAGAAAVCTLCGGPRIAANFGGSDAALALTEQKRNLTVARIASTATVLQGLFAVVATLVGLAVHPATLSGKLIAFVIAAVPLVLALASRVRASAARERAKAANGRAWQAAAEDAARRTPEGVRASDLAAMLGVDPSEADRLLTSLAVQDRTRIDVGDDAEVRYRVARDGAGAEAEHGDRRFAELEAAEAAAIARKEPAR